MATMTADRDVAKSKGKDASQVPLSVKLPADVVESSRIVAAFRNEAMAEMLGNILRPILAQMEREEIAKRSKRGER